MPKSTKAKAKKKRVLHDPVMDSFTKKFGKTSSGKRVLFGKVTDWISTGSTALNATFGRDGLPCGRLSSIRGPESAGKTAVSTSIGAQCQKRGGRVIYFDTEYAYEWDHAARAGLYSAEFFDECPYEDALPAIPVYPEHIEGAFEQMEYLILQEWEVRPDGLLLIVLDSVAGLPAKAEAEGKWDQVFPGLHARLYSHGLRKIGRLVAKHRIALLFVEQPKDALSMGGPPMKGRGGGGPASSLAGRPIGFHSTIKMEIKRKGFIGEKKSTSSGIESIVSIIKNKVGPPFRECIIPIMFGIGSEKPGVDDDRSTLDMAVELGIVVKKPGGVFKLRGSKHTFKRAQWPDVKDYAKVIELLHEAIKDQQDHGFAARPDRKRRPSTEDEEDTDDDDDDDEDDD